MVCALNKEQQLGFYKTIASFLWEETNAGNPIDLKKLTNSVYEELGSSPEELETTLMYIQLIPGYIDEISAFERKIKKSMVDTGFDFSDLSKKVFSFEDPATGLQAVRDYVTPVPVTEAEIEVAKETVREETQAVVEAKRAEEVVKAQEKVNKVKTLSEAEFTAVAGEVLSDRGQEAIEWQDEGALGYNIPNPEVSFFYKVKRFLKEFFDNKGANDVSLPGHSGIRLTAMTIQNLSKEEISEHDTKPYVAEGKTASLYDRNEPVMVITDKEGRIVRFNKETGKPDVNGAPAYYYVRSLYPGNFETKDGQTKIKLWKKGANAKPKTQDDYDRALALARRERSDIKQAEMKIRNQLEFIHKMREALKKDPSLKVGLNITSITPGYIKYDLAINTPLGTVSNQPSTFNYAPADNSALGLKKGNVYFTNTLVGEKPIVLERAAVKDVDGLTEKITALLFDPLKIGNGSITASKRKDLLIPYLLFTKKGGSGANIDIHDSPKKKKYTVLLNGEEIFDSSKPEQAEEAKKKVTDYFNQVQVQGVMSNEDVANKGNKIISGASAAEVADQFEKGGIFHDTTTNTYYGLGYPKMQLAQIALNKKYDDVEIGPDGQLTIVQKDYNKDYVVPNTFIHYQLNADNSLIALNPRITFEPANGTAEQLKAALNPEAKKEEVKPVVEKAKPKASFLAAGRLDALNTLLDQKGRQTKAVQEQLEKAIAWYTGLTGDEFQEFETLQKLGMGRTDAQTTRFNTLKAKFDKGAHPIAKVVPLSVMFNAVNTANDKSLATWSEAGITLYKGADFSEIYHEAWHAFTQTFLTQEEQTKLYDEVKKKSGGFIDYKGHHVSFSSASPLQLEEYLAEQFREYMLKDGKVSYPKSPVQKSIFQKILDYLVAFFKDVSINELNSDQAASKVINEMYEKLRIGNLTEYSFDQANANFDVLHTGAIAYDPDATITSINYEDSDRMVAVMDGLLSQFVDLVTAEKQKNLGTNSTKWTSTLLKNPEGLKLGYLHIKEVLTGATVPLTAKYEKEVAEGNTLESAKTLKLLNLYDWTVNQLGDTENLMNNRPGKGEEPRGMIAYHQMKSKILLEEDKEAFFDEDALSEDDLFVRGREGHDIKGNEVSLKQRASQEILFLFNSLQKTDAAGNRVHVPGTMHSMVIDELGTTIEIGVPVMEDFDRVWNRVVKTLENELDAQRMFVKLDALADKVPSLPIRQLLTKLGDIENKSLEEVSLWTNFWQTFNKARVPLLQTTVSIKTKNDEGAKISYENMTFSVKPGRASSDTTKIKGFWKSLFLTGKMEDGTSNPYIAQESDSGRRYLNVDKIYAEFVNAKADGLKAGKTPLEFFRALGLNFDEDNDEIIAALKRINVGLWTYRIANINFRENARLYNLESIVEAFPVVPTKNRPGQTQNKLENESGNFRELLEIQAKYSDKWGNFMVSNAEGNTQFEHTLNNFLTITVNSLNDAESYEDLISKPWMRHLDIKHNPQAAASVWLKSMFDMEEYANGGVGKRRTTSRGQLVTLNLENLSGVAVEKDGVYDDDLGIASANADPVTKLIMDFHMALLKGAPELMRHADKSTSFAAFMSHILMQGAAGNVYVDTKNFMKTPIAGSSVTSGDEYAVNNYMMPNLKAELERIRNVEAINKAIEKVKKDNPNASVEELDNLIYQQVGLIDKAYLKAGVAFTIFSDVLTADTKKALKKGTIQYNDERVKKDMITYINKETARVTKMFDKAARKGKHLFSNEALDKVREGTDPITEKHTQALIKSFTVNSWIHNLESINIIYGDLAQYNMAKEEFHKRNAGASSTGDIHRTDKAMIDFVNQKLGKQMSSDATLNTVILNDVAPNSAYLEAYGEAMVEDLVKNKKMDRTEAQKKIYGYDSKTKTVGTAKEPLKGGTIYEYTSNKIEEANAQAWMSFDTYRALQVMRGAWNPDTHEILYQKLIKEQEVSPADVAKFFPPLKLQYWGPLANTDVAGNTPLNAFHKYSMLPLIPTLIKDKNMADIAAKMKNENIDYITFKSGSKVTNLTKYSGLDSLYSDDKRTVSNKPYTVNKIFIEYLKNQLETGDKFKGQTIFATQLRKLIEDGLIENGVPVDFAVGKRPEERIKAWKNLEVYIVKDKVINPEATEAARQKASPNYKLYKLYEKNLNTLTQVKTKELLDEMGWEIGDDGLPTGPLESLVRFVKSELTKKDLSEHELAFIDVVSKGSKMNLKHDFSISQSAEMIEKMLNNMVGKRLVKQKVNGEGLIQISGTGLESKNAWLGARSGTAEELEKWGTNDLPTYHQPEVDDRWVDFMKRSHPNWKAPEGYKRPTTAMKVKVALQGKFKYLLNLNDKEGNRIGTVERLNTLLKDEEWLNTGDHRRMITMVGVRIPVQGLNSMEFMEVYEFLPAEAGNIIVPPTEIVAKSGSDFDIDKLTVFMPSIANYRDGVSLIQYNSKLAQTETKSSIEEQLAEQYELKAGTKDFYKEWFDEQKEEGIFKKLTPEEKAIVNNIRNEYRPQIFKINQDIEAVQKERVKIKKLSTKTDSDKIRLSNLTSDLISLNEAKDRVEKSLKEKISQYKTIFTQVKEGEFKAKQAKDLERIDVEIDKLNRKKHAISSEGVQNDILWNIKSILELPSNYISLITPNSTDLVKPLADELAKKREYKAKDRLQGTLSKEDAAELGENMDQIAGTRILEVGYNMYKHASNNVGKQVLGIGAIDNTFNSIFNRVGARLKAKLKIGENEIEQKLRMAHNTITTKEGPSISLSHLYNPEGERISDLISQLMNGWVDVAKDAWIFDIQGNKELSPILLFLIQSGVPLKTAVYFISQPIIREFADEQKLSMSSFSEMLGKGTNVKQFEQTALNNIIQKYEIKDRKGNKLTYSTFNPTQNQTLNLKVMAQQAVNDAGTDVFDVKNLGEALDGPLVSENFQKAVFLHFMEIRAMSNAVRDVKMAMNFDTAKSTTTFEANAKIRKVEEVLDNPRFAWNMAKDILEDSPISSFYVQPLQVTLFRDLFPLRNHPKFIKFVEDVINSKDYRNDIKDTFGDEIMFGNALQSDFVNYIFQNQLRAFDLTKATSYKGSAVSTDISKVPYLANGAALVDGKLYVDLRTLNNQFTLKSFATKAYNQLGLSVVPADTFSNVQEYYHFVVERENLRAQLLVNPNLKESYEYKRIVKNLIQTRAKQENEETSSYNDRIGRAAFEQFIAEKALHNIYNPKALFTGAATVADKYNNILEAYPELLKDYSVLSKLVPSVAEDKVSKKMYTNLILSEKIDDMDYINLYHSQIMTLADPTERKVESEVDNAMISQFFKNLSLVGFMQTGLNSKTSFSITRILPEENYTSIIESGLEDVMTYMNEVTLQKYYKEFLTQNSSSRARFRNRYKDYYESSYNVKAEYQQSLKKGISTLVNPGFEDINYITDDTKFTQKEGRLPKLFKFEKDIILGKASNPFEEVYTPVLKSAYTYEEVFKFLNGQGFSTATARRKPIMEALKVAGFDSKKLNELFFYKPSSSMSAADAKTLKNKQGLVAMNFMVLYTQGLAESSMASDISKYGDFNQVEGKVDVESIQEEVKILINALSQMGKVRDRYASSKFLHRNIDGNLVYGEEVSNKERVDMLVRDNKGAIFLYDGLTGAETVKSSVAVKPVIDLSKEWSGDLKTRPVYTAEGVNTMRTQAAKPNEHFGNPFSEAGYGGTRKVPSIPVAVEVYKEWLLTGYAQWLDEEGNAEDFAGNVEQRKWILDQINQGKLDGVTLLYAGKSAARGQGMHPTALAEVVEELRGGKVFTKPKTTTAYKGNQAFSQVSPELADRTMPLPTYNQFSLTKDNVIKDVDGAANPLVVKEINEALDAIERTGLEPIFSEEGYGQALLGLDKKGNKLPFIKETPAKETFLYLSKELLRRFGYVNKNYLNNETVKTDAIEAIETLQPVSTSVVEEFMKRCK